MADNTKPRQRWNATGADDTNPTGNLTPPPSIRNAGAPVELRRNPGACIVCARPLEEAELVCRAVRTLRSGEWIGGRGEYRTYRCDCGTLRRVLHSVQMPAHRGRRG